MSEIVQSGPKSEMENRLPPAEVTSLDGIGDLILRGLWIAVYDLLIRVFIVVRTVEHRLGRSASNKTGTM